MTAHSLAFPTPATSRTDRSSRGTGPEVTTALICDNSLLRSGLQHVLSGTLFALAEEGPATVSRLVSGTVQEPGLIILAVSQLSSRTTEMVQQVKERYPAMRIVVLAEHFDPEFLRQGLDAGVKGFCLTSSSREVLITSLELVVLGELALPAKLVLSMLNAAPLSSEPGTASEAPDKPKASAPQPSNLSAREAEILSSLMEGAPNKIIARKLHVAEATVKVHVKAILRKIGVANRTQAAMWAKGHLHG